MDPRRLCLADWVCSMSCSRLQVFKKHYCLAITTAVPLADTISMPLACPSTS